VTYILTLACIVFTAPCINNSFAARKCRKAVLLLSEFQLAAGIALLAVAIWKRHDISWIDSRFLLDSAAVAGWSSIMAAMVRPGYNFRKEPINVVALVCYDGLVAFVGISVHTQMEAMNVTHHCIEEETIRETLGFEIMLFSIVIWLQLSHMKLPGWDRLVFGLVLLAFCVMLEVFYLFYDYATFKPLISHSVDGLGVSQLLTLTTAFFPIISNIVVGFKLSSEHIHIDNATFYANIHQDISHGFLETSWIRQPQKS
jgi:hypothetical protein